MKQDEPERDLIAEYREWAENRYNPGHWLGGNVPPSVSNLPSTKDARWFGAICIAASLIGAAFGVVS